MEATKGLCKPKAAGQGELSYGRFAAHSIKAVLPDHHILEPFNKYRALLFSSCSSVAVASTSVLCETKTRARHTATMATLEPSVVLPAPIKTSGQKSMSVEAVAGPSPDSVAASGTVALTNVPKLGEPEAFFPANPAMSSELAQNKPVKQLASDDRTSSGGILRTISDVITDLRQKHQDKKRVSTKKRCEPYVLSKPACVTVHSAFLGSGLCTFCSHSQIGMQTSSTYIRLFWVLSWSDV